MRDITEDLKRRGWPPMQASVLAALIEEAGGRPWGPDGNASTWRADKLKLWANPRDIGDAAVQIDFISYELKTVFSKLVQEMNKATTGRNS